MANQDITTFSQGMDAFMEALRKEQAELHYLKWFKQNADFGPADSDVHAIMNDQYEERTGRAVPEGWREE
jgi:hypothetical protein